MKKLEKEWFIVERKPNILLCQRKKFNDGKTYRFLKRFNSIKEAKKYLKQKNTKCNL